jgi:chromosome segregation ATPase
MEELTELQKKLEECRRHSDNHRRSRDYHKEQAADLREEVKELEGTLEFWRAQHTKMDNAFCEARYHHQRWMSIAIVLGIFSLGMTVLFFWAVRM